MKRLFDFVFAFLLLVIFLIPIIIIAFAVRITSEGPAIYFSDRIGKSGSIFKMPKFRSMKLKTPNIATHLLENPNNYLSPIGGFLRKTSLDELPQLYSIIKGDMSFVGPRPALFNQDDLIQLRIKYKVDTLVPGVTGWAQINGRDSISISDKVNLDVYYLKNRSFFFDMKIIFLTVLNVSKRDNISH